jgi:hypothetical protein
MDVGPLADAGVGREQQQQQQQRQQQEPQAEWREVRR